MRKRVSKPQGQSGPIKIGPEGAVWEVMALPDNKAERERLIAEIVSNASANHIAGESAPSLKPIKIARQNDEDDLDFTIETPVGEKLMELAEFAPLSELGGKFSDSPRSVDPRRKAELALALVQRKSERQGGDGRVLVIHATEQAFELDNFTIEIMRRRLKDSRPKFDRVYFVSVDHFRQGPLSEIFPGEPYGMAGEMSDEDLNNCRVIIPHPRDVLGTSGSN